MIENDGTGTKPLYEPPKITKLDGKNSSMGDCAGSGSGDTYCYSVGNSAVYNCGDGSSDGSLCWTGNGASGDCKGEGNSVV